MAPLTFVLVVILLLNGDVSGEEDVVANINVITTNVLNGLKTFLPKKGWTSLSLPDVEQEFEKRVVFVNVKGKIGITEGKVSNFYDAVRYGDELLTYNLRNDILTVQFGLTLNDIRAAFHLTTKTSMSTLDMSNLPATATLKGPEGSLTISIDLKTLKLKAEKLDLKTVGAINVEVPGAGFGAKTLISLLPVIATTMVKSAIQSNGVQMVQGALDLIDLNEFLPE